MHSLNEVIHKESSKEKLNAKGLKPLGIRPKAKELKENTAVNTQMQMSNGQQTKGEHSKYRLAQMRKNSEIDSFLNDLLIEGLINAEYWSFHAKACHALGLSLCNRLAINARNGMNSQRLYAYKIKGALQVHYKQQYDNQTTHSGDSQPEII